MRVNLTQLRPGPIVVMPLFTCNVSCQHCQHACSPVRRERMPFDLFESVVHQALDTNFTSLCLSGGEPFLLPSYIEPPPRHVAGPEDFSLSKRMASGVAADRNSATC